MADAAANGTVDDARLAAIAERMDEFVTFAEAARDFGFPQFAARARCVTDDLAYMLERVQVEHGARVRAQELHREALRLLGNRAGEAARAMVPA